MFYGTESDAGYSMPFHYRDIVARVYGGPFHYRPDGIKTVKMAAEIDAPCDISVPTRDFSVPDMNDLLVGLWKGVRILRRDKTLFVGCAGGRGRTGLYLAALARLMAADGYNVGDPVGFVRKTYNKHAVETQEQRDFINAMPVKGLHFILGIPGLK